MTPASKSFTRSAALRGTLRVPGDKSISHRAVLMAAMANGSSRIRGLSNGDDVQRSIAALQLMGAEVTRTDSEVVVSSDPEKQITPNRPLYLGNSGTSARLLCGWIAGQGLKATLTGDASLSVRPMRRVVEPLRKMGAAISGPDGGETLPLSISASDLVGIEFSSVVRSAQVKAAVLLAGLGANGPTVVHEDVQTRAHTEEMLMEFGADIKCTEHNDGGCTITLRPSTIRPFDLDVATDPSQAAFWMVAAAVVPDSDITLENVYVGVGRGGMIDVLARMGADIDVDYRSSVTADIRVRHSALVATEVADDEIPSLIDELPVLAIAAAFAEGTTVVADAEELRVKESDRISAVCTQIAGLGVLVQERPDGFVIQGRPDRLLDGGQVQANLDHRIAMTGAIAGLVASSPVVVEGWDSVASSYPGFVEDLERLTRT